MAGQWSFSRVAVATLAVVALAWSVWTIASPVREDVSANHVLSPIEARQREILKDNLDRPGDPDLVRRYQTLNTTHFAGRLPNIPVLWEPRLAEVGQMAARAFTLEGMFGHIGDKSAILLHPNLALDHAALMRALSHEMVHAYLYSIGDPSTSHGPAFRTELQRLASEGAFTGIVADDAVRTSLRAWLDEEASRLDADANEVRREGEEIERERAELERAFAEINARSSGGPPTREEVDRLNARRDAYNRRVEDANLRTERGRAALAEFNKQVERYNLMLVYPDGIDEEDLVKPRTPGTR
jgi:hypothetical protein